MFDFRPADGTYAVTFYKIGSWPIPEEYISATLSYFKYYISKTWEIYTYGEGAKVVNNWQSQRITGLTRKSAQQSKSRNFYHRHSKTVLNVNLSLLIFKIVHKKSMCDPHCCMLPDFEILSDENKVIFYFEFMKLIWVQQRDILRKSDS